MADWPPNRKQKFRWLYLAEWENTVTAACIGFALVAATVYATSSYIGSGFWVLIIFLALCLFIYAGATFSAAWKAAHRLRYDPRLALELNRIFFKEMAVEREEGTKQAIRFVQDPKSVEDFSDIDAIIDFLDDIGFLVEGHQISDWVAYHYLFAWVRMYYEALEPYITKCRKEEPAVWEYLKPLYDDLIIIEAYKSKMLKRRWHSRSQNFLKNSELNLWKAQSIP